MAKEREVEVMSFMNAEEKGDDIMIEVKKADNKVVKKFKELKTWQKVAVATVTVLGLGAAGYGAYKLLTPDTAVDLVEAAAEAGLNTVAF